MFWTGFECQMKRMLCIIQGVGQQEKHGLNLTLDSNESFILFGLMQSQ
jgi:hypothetical protein